MKKSATKKPLLSIIIPIFNEEATILTVLSQVNNSPIQSKEIIVVDDGSTDNSFKILKNNRKLFSVLLTTEKNQGKGAALQLGIQKATGKVTIIQDADLEYSPEEYSKIIQPIIDEKADVVYGSRFRGCQAHRVLYFWHYFGNKTLTLLTNIVTNLNLTDMETGYKACKTEFLQQLSLQEKSFAIEPEITIKLAQMKLRFYEVGISYHGRTYEEGKKITAKDGLTAVGAIIKYGVCKPILASFLK